MCILKAFLERIECCICMFPSLSRSANTLMYSFHRSRVACVCMCASIYVPRCLCVIYCLEWVGEKEGFI